VGQRLSEVAARALAAALTERLAATNRAATTPPQRNAKEIIR
jgi:hypothetical protein